MRLEPVSADRLASSLYLGTLTRVYTFKMDRQKQSRTAKIFIFTNLLSFKYFVLGIRQIILQC